MRHEWTDSDGMPVAIERTERGVTEYLADWNKSGIFENCTEASIQWSAEILRLAERVREHETFAGECLEQIANRDTRIAALEALGRQQHSDNEALIRENRRLREALASGNAAYDALKADAHRAEVARDLAADRIKELEGDLATRTYERNAWKGKAVRLTALEEELDKARAGWGGEVEAHAAEARRAAALEGEREVMQADLDRRAAVLLSRDLRIDELRAEVRELRAVILRDGDIRRVQPVFDQRIKELEEENARLRAVHSQLQACASAASPDAPLRQEILFLLPLASGSSEPVETLTDELKASWDHWKDPLKP